MKEDAVFDEYEYYPSAFNTDLYKSGESFLYQRDGACERCRHDCKHDSCNCMLLL